MQLFSTAAAVKKGKPQRPLFVSTRLPAQARTSAALESATVEEYGGIIKAWASAKGLSVREFRYDSGELFAWLCAPRRVRNVRLRVQRCKKLFLTVAYRVATAAKKR